MERKLKKTEFVCFTADLNKVWKDHMKELNRKDEQTIKNVYKEDKTNGRSKVILIDCNQLTLNTLARVMSDYCTSDKIEAKDRHKKLVHIQLKKVKNFLNRSLPADITDKKEVQPKRTKKSRVKVAVTNEELKIVQV